MEGVQAQRIKDVNVAYHDGAAPDYDSKWNIQFDDEACQMIRDKLAKALGHEPPSFGHTLEIGAGTGYFTLNLLRAGHITRATATDISPGMLATLEASASELGLEVETACCEAAELPFPDGSFDVVMGHAVLHHLPDLDAAFAEFSRVLKPGGLVVFAGEPSHYGDRLAGIPKRAALVAAPAWRRLVGAGRRVNGHVHEAEVKELEPYVDVHAFTPGDLRSHARAGGFEEVRVAGEELTCSLFGWFNRALEATAEPDEIPHGWSWYAYGGYMALRRVDTAVLEPRLPAAIFYNLMISARAPGA
jgi:ubiquinone/menaquinone biosynthesis C-methylase UbiE